MLGWPVIGSSLGPVFVCVCMCVCVCRVYFVCVFALSLPGPDFSPVLTVFASP